MKIFFPDTHLTLTKNMTKAFSKLGHTTLIPSKDYEVTIWPPQKWVWNNSHNESSIEKYDLPKDTLFVNKEQLFDLKPEVIFITAFENKFEIFDVIYKEAINWGAKLVFYSGNDYWPEAYSFDLIDNFLPADKLGATLAEKNKKNFLHYKPWIDYEMFSFDGTSDGNTVGTYICDYRKNFPQDFECYRQTKELTNYDYILCEKSTKQETADIMHKSCFTLHVKSQEGYGYAIIESMAKGRPVFFWEPQTAGKSYLDWLDLGVTGFTFRDVSEFKSQSEFFLNEKEFRHETQTKCASRIRELIDNERENDKLKTFLENLL